MSRSEANSASAGFLLLAVAVLAIAIRLLGGGSTFVTLAMICLVGSLVAFVVAWLSSWTDPLPAAIGPGRRPQRLFPIADYDELWVSEIVPMLAELDDDELEDVFRYEQTRAARPRVLNQIAALLARPRIPRGRNRR